MDNQNQHKNEKEVNYYVTFHGMLSDKIIKTLPYNTNLIMPSCCGNVNYSVGMDLNSYFNSLKTGIIDKLNLHTGDLKKPKIIRLKLNKPYKIYYGMSLNEYGIEYGNASEKAINSHEYCDIIISPPYPYESVQCGIKNLNDPQSRILPTKFTHDGFNLMKKIINESNGFPKDDRHYNLKLNTFKLDVNDWGYTNLSQLQHTYIFFIYNIHYIVYKKIDMFNRGIDISNVDKFIILSETGELVDLIMNDNDVIKSLMEINPEITKLNDDLNKLKNPSEESDIPSSKLEIPPSRLRGYVRPKPIESIEIKILLHIKLHQNKNLFQSICNIIDIKSSSDLNIIYNIVFNTPKYTRYQSYHYYSDQIQQGSQEICTEIISKPPSIIDHILFKHLMYGYYLACKLSNLTDFEYTIYNSITYQKIIVQKNEIIGSYLSHIIEKIRSLYEPHIVVNIINESCQFTQDNSDSGQCIAMYCIANTLSDVQHRKILSKDLSRGDIIKHLKEIHTNKKYRHYFEPFPMNPLYGFTDDDIMTLTFVYNYFLSPTTSISKSIDQDSIQDFNYIIWLAKEVKFDRQNILNKATVYANASLILHEIGVISD